MVSVAVVDEKAFEVATEDALSRKVFLHVMPILFLGYFIAYLDRVNVGFAKLEMLGDLKFSDAVYGAGAGMFFVGYFFFQLPSNLILRHVGARLWIGGVTVSWGLVSAATAFVQTPTEFYLARFVLGLAEAGFFPAAIIFLMHWYPSHRRGKMVALLMSGNPVSGIIGSPISGFILHTFVGGYQGLASWQWLFLIEASPAILLGIVIFFALNDRVQDAGWLTAAEKSFLTEQIELEATTKVQTSLRSVFLSLRVWLMIVLCFGIIMGTSAVSFWLPTIIRQTGVSNTFNIGLLTMMPYAAALVTMILTGRDADRTRERRWHVVGPTLMAAVGFSLCAQAGDNTYIAVIGLTLATAGILTALPMFWSLPTAFLGGAAAAAGVPFINCIGSLSGFFSPAIIGALKSYTGSLNSGLYLVVACLVATAILIVACVPARLVNR